jgi:hypothetical protein
LNQKSGDLGIPNVNSPYMIYHFKKLLLTVLRILPEVPEVPVNALSYCKIIIIIAGS